jgi:Ca-activated chloride channel family protein
MLLTALFAWSPPTARADGIVIPCPPPLPDGRPVPCPTPVPGRPIYSLAIKYHRVNVRIDNQIATTRIDQVFINDSGVDLEGTYVFPLPEDATVGEFAMWIDGKRVEAQVLDKDKAKQIYVNIVNSMRDPALLEYIGRGAFQARVYPIPARGEKRIELEYKQVLQSDNGLIKYVYPLNTEKFSSRPLQDVSVSVSIRSKDAIKAIYSPSHDVSVQRSGDYGATTGWEAKNVRPDRDFALYYSVSQGDIALNLLTYKPNTREDGFFVLLAAPKVEARSSEVVAKDVIYVLDVSGSMQGAKIDQAKKALEYVIDKLNPEDSFNIITFSTGVTKYANSLRPGTEKREALSFIRAVRAEGSTNINRALLEALAMVQKSRPTLVIFMTDGLPTTDETNPQRIIANAKSAAPSNVRLFAFGVGYDVNTFLLDSLSQQMRGLSAYIKPNEDINEAVSAFYAKVATPVLADLKIDWGSIVVNDMYPMPLPDLFAGQQLVLVGRYRSPPAGSGFTTVKLSGTVNGQLQTFTYQTAFNVGGGDESLARIWATRKIGYLLDQIRFKGAQKEIVDEIVALSVRYGIVTPYTSFLVTETEKAMNQAGRDRLSNEAQKAYDDMARTQTGAAAVQQSQANQGMNQAQSAPAPVMPQATAAAGQRPGGGGPPTAVNQDPTQIIKYIGDKTFVNNNGVWMDTTYDTQNMKTQKVTFQSADYYKLLDARPEWGRYFAAGNQVIVVVDGNAYEVIDPNAPQAQPTPSTPLIIPSPLPPTPVRGSQIVPTATPAGVSQVVPQPTVSRSTTATTTTSTDMLATSIMACGIGLAAMIVVVGGVVWLRRRSKT